MDVQPIIQPTTEPTTEPIEQPKTGFWAFILEKDEEDEDMPWRQQLKSEPLEQSNLESERVYLLQDPRPGTPQISYMTSRIPRIAPHTSKRYERQRELESLPISGEIYLVDIAGKPHSIINENGVIKSVSGETRWFCNCNCCLLAIGFDVPEWIKQLLGSRYIPSS